MTKLITRAGYTKNVVKQIVKVNYHGCVSDKSYAWLVSGASGQERNCACTVYNNRELLVVPSFVFWERSYNNNNNSDYMYLLCTCTCDSSGGSRGSSLGSDEPPFQPLKYFFFELTK